MKRVAIVPAVAYVNGKQMTATSFNVVSVADNLFDHVIFKYTLYDGLGNWAGEASYELKGVVKYSEWDASPDGAYEIVAKGVDLEILPTLSKSMFLEDI